MPLFRLFHPSRRLCPALAFGLLTFPALAEVFVPMPSNSALTLGSGVNLLQPDSALPGCFDFRTASRDAPTTQSYSIAVKAFSSVEEIYRERRRSGSASASYGGAAAALQAWNNAINTDKKAALFVVIEARYIGPRVLAESLTPTAAAASLLANGTPTDLIKRCGSHVVTVEHRGQTMRVLINLSDADQYAKQEIGARFGAKARYGAFKAQASGSYGSTLVKMAQSKTLDMAVEGTGTAPDATRILDLFKTKAGDLNAVADALGAMLAAANLGATASHVTYGLTLQPLSRFTSLVPQAGDNKQDLIRLEQLQDYLAMLGAQIERLSAELTVMGLPEAQVKKLQADLNVQRQSQARLRADVAGCLWAAADSEQGCDAQVGRWRQLLAELRGARAGLVVATEGEKGVFVQVESAYPATATLVVNVDGQDIALDTFKIFPGRTRIALVAVAPSSGPTPAREVTELPVTLHLAFLLAMIREEGGAVPVDRGLQVGCFGGAAFGEAGLSRRTSSPTMKNTLSPDSLCYGRAPAAASMLGMPFMPVIIGGFGSPQLPLPTLPGLMPPGTEALRLDMPRLPVVLKLATVDAFGFEATHLLTADLAQELIRLMDLKARP